MTYSAVDGEPILERLRRLRAMANREAARGGGVKPYWNGYATACAAMIRMIETRAVRWEEER